MPEMLDLEVPCDKHRISYGSVEFCPGCVQEMCERLAALEKREAEREKRKPEQAR